MNIIIERSRQSNNHFYPVIKRVNLNMTGGGRRPGDQAAQFHFKHLTLIQRGY